MRTGSNEPESYISKTQVLADVAVHQNDFCLMSPFIKICLVKCYQIWDTFCKSDWLKKLVLRLVVEAAFDRYQWQCRHIIPERTRQYSVVWNITEFEASWEWCENPFFSVFSWFDDQKTTKNNKNHQKNHH